MAPFGATLGACFAVAASARTVATASLHSGCQEVLGRFATSDYSGQELAALCRAKVPSSVCGDAMRMLGERPWAAQDMDAVCSIWQQDYESRVLKVAPSRQTLFSGDGQQQMDTVVANKDEQLEGAAPDAMKDVDSILGDKVQDAKDSVAKAKGVVKDVVTDANADIAGAGADAKEATASGQDTVASAAGAATGAVADATTATEGTLADAKQGVASAGGGVGQVDREDKDLTFLGNATTTADSTLTDTSQADDVHESESFEEETEDVDIDLEAVESKVELQEAPAGQSFSSFAMCTGLVMATLLAGGVVVLVRAHSRTKYAMHHRVAQADEEQNVFSGSEHGGCVE